MPNRPGIGHQELWSCGVLHRWKDPISYGAAHRQVWQGCLLLGNQLKVTNTHPFVSQIAKPQSTALFCIPSYTGLDSCI